MEPNDENEARGEQEALGRHDEYSIVRYAPGKHTLPMIGYFDSFLFRGGFAVIAKEELGKSLDQWKTYFLEFGADIGSSAETEYGILLTFATMMFFLPRID